jgi:hypothetical protein
MRFRDEDEDLDLTDDSPRARRLRDKARGRRERQERTAKVVRHTGQAVEALSTIARTIREARRSVRRG